MKMISENQLTPSYGETPPIQPRQLHFFTKSTPETMQSISEDGTPASKQDKDQNKVAELETEIANLKSLLEDKRYLVEQIASDNANIKEQLVAHLVRQEELEQEKKRLEKEIQRLLDLNEALKTLEERLSKKDEESANFERDYLNKCKELDTVQDRLKESLANIEVYKQQIESQNNVISNKDDLLSKYEKDMLNYAQNESKHIETINKLQCELRDLAEHASSQTKDDYAGLKNEYGRLKDILSETEAELTEKMVAYEKCLLDIDEHEKTIYHLNDVLTDSKTARSVEEIRIQMRQVQDRNQELTEEVKQLNQRLNRNEHSASPRPFSLDEITSRVEKELNYSAQLDSSILKAIESDDNENDNPEIPNERERLETSVKMLQEKYDRMQESIAKERKGFGTIREQDATCIDTITKRLEAALVQETELNRLLDDERKRTSLLVAQLSEQQLQRGMFSGNDLVSSPAASPRRGFKGADVDTDLVNRLNDEIKLLKSQSERERERSDDLERVLLREKGRFEKELSDRKSYGDSIKQELSKVLQENQILQNDLNQTQNR